MSENKQETSEEVDEELLEMERSLAALEGEAEKLEKGEEEGSETREQMRRRRKTIKVHATRSRSLLGTWRPVSFPQNSTSTLSLQER